MSHPLRLLFRRSKFILSIGVIVSILSAGVSLLFPLEYRADGEVLIIPRTSIYADAYSATRSAERVAEILSQIMYSSDFYEKVMSQSNYQLDVVGFASATEQEQRKYWERTISSSVVFNSGILKVSAFHLDPLQAEALVSAMIETLVVNAKDYVGTDLTIRTVNSPVASSWPVRPNIPINAAIGFGIGILLASIIAIRQ